MKYEWEAEDIIPGRVVRHKNTKATNNKAIICFHLDGLFSLVSLADGFVIFPLAQRKELLDWLNSSNCEPTDDDRETTRAIDYLRGVR